MLSRYKSSVNMNVKIPSICAKCAKDPVNEKDKIVCDLCSSLFHSSCCGLSKSEVFCLRVSEKKIIFFCDACSSLLPTIRKQNNSIRALQADTDQLKEELRYDDVTLRKSEESSPKPPQTIEESSGDEDRDDSLKFEEGEVHKHDDIRQVSLDNSSTSSDTSDSEPQSLSSAFTNNSESSSHIFFDKAKRIQELHLTLLRTTKDSCDYKRELNEGKLEKAKSADANLNKFQNYVKMMPKYQESSLTKHETLFYCCLIVNRFTDKPRIVFRFPRNAVVPNKIEDLCYPEADSGPLDISNSAQCYSLVITNDKGERTFGYCRRIIPEGSTKCIPLTYCILSKHRAPRFYKKILTELESRHGIPYKLRDELISKLYYNKFPRPGQSIEIHLSGDCNGVETEASSPDNNVKNEEYDSTIKIQGNSLEFTLTLHPDTRYEEADLKPLHTLPSHILLKIFGSLLLERKVILISCVISKLSSCVDALQSILYPFSWPHTFIPVLPQSLWGVVESPTPVICGILSIEVINKHGIENGIVVDLDTEKIIVQEGDEYNILPRNMKKLWNEGINSAHRKSQEDYSHSVSLSDTYINVFILAMKHYKDHIVNNTFEKEAFIKSGRSKSIRQFLKWFTETTMFISFIETVINDSNSFSLFDEKIKMLEFDKSKPILQKILWTKR